MPHQEGTDIVLPLPTQPCSVAVLEMAFRDEAPETVTALLDEQGTWHFSRPVGGWGGWNPLGNGCAADHLRVVRVLNVLTPPATAPQGNRFRGADWTRSGPATALCGADGTTQPVFISVYAEPEESAAGVMDDLLNLLNGRPA